MLVIGRVTRNANVKTVGDDKQVVEFTIAENHYFRQKGDEKGKQVTTYYNCSYWINTGIADRLKKGVLVEINGQLTARAYQSVQGEPKASLNIHVDLIRIHTTGNGMSVDAAGNIQNGGGTAVEITEPIDDLPF